HKSLVSLADWKWDIRYQRSVIRNRLGESGDQAKDFLGGSLRLPDLGVSGLNLGCIILPVRNRGEYRFLFGLFRGFLLFQKLFQPQKLSCQRAALRRPSRLPGIAR